MNDIVIVDAVRSAVGRAKKGSPGAVARTSSRAR
jgi:acetyl-CoA acetyltransferase